MQPNFTQCALEFLNNPDLYSNYTYTGPVNNIFNTINTSSTTTLISVEGCQELCGAGSDYYPWDQVSGTISTWVLPLMGLILQMPFDSNQFRRTVLALTRWLGSPIVSLSYIFWNIRVTGTCAQLVDMTTRYENIPHYNETKPSQFEQLRDSFYIMSVMNQYSFRKSLPDKTGEKLLRAALFGDDFDQPGLNNLARKRRKLANSLRELRKKGVVPVFVSLVWFLFSLITSIQAAWGQLGTNATAHDLALGLLTAWLPTLVLCCIVDRNPVATEPVKQKLNKFVATTRSILLNKDDQLREQGGFDPRFTWTRTLKENPEDWDTFFVDFAGQGRIRWHYGIAQPIIVGIEESFDLDHGREWLEGSDFRQRLVDGPADRGVQTLKGLHWFDMKELWQLVSANLTVLAAVAGAFLISFFTPTVGLGCRSGGYMIFFLLAFGLFLMEYLSWWLTHDMAATLGESFTNERPLGRRSKYNARSFLESIILRPLECFNTVWLIYIVFAQTFGSYQTCACMGSTWGSGGGYINFQTWAYYDNRSIYNMWAGATALSIITMFLAFIYIVIEWCEQSHFCSAEYEKARRGLFRTRFLKLHTLWLRLGPLLVFGMVRRWCKRRFGVHKNGKQRRRSRLVWTSKARKNPSSQRGSRGGGRYESLKGADSESFKLEATIAVQEMHGEMSPQMDRALLLQQQQQQQQHQHQHHLQYQHPQHWHADEETGYGLQTLGSPYHMRAHSGSSEQDITGRGRLYSPG